MKLTKTILNLNMLAVLLTLFSCTSFLPGDKPLEGGNKENAKAGGNKIEVIDFGENPIGKKGLCYNHLTAAEVQALGSDPAGVKWVYNWAPAPTAAEDTLFTQYNILFVPMQWGLSTEQSRQALKDYYTSHPNCRYLLGYNEPNLGAGVGGSGITPAQAAADWDTLEAIAEEFNLELVGPALQYSGETLSDGKIYSTPQLWMDAFIAEYKKLHSGKEPRYDYFALHCYMNWPSAQSGYIKEYAQKYGKQIWLTEFCAWEYNNGGQNESMEKQTSSMKEKLSFMEGSNTVAKYAWFMSHGNVSAIPYNSIFENKNSDGSLTTLGKAYLNLN